MTKSKILAMQAPVTISAGAAEDNSPPKFEVVAYTGGAMQITGWEHPVVIDLEGMDFSNSLVANLDHDRTKRVGHVTAKEKTIDTLTLSGVASAATESRREVVESAAGGFGWQASVEATPRQVREVAADKKTTVNGQTFAGPLYVASQTTLTGFGFVSHGADDSTQVTIAATADLEEDNVNPKLKAWVEEIGFDPENISDDELSQLKANYGGRQAPAAARQTSSNPFEARKLEAKRRREMRDIADRQIDLRNSDEEEIIAIEKMYDHAVEANMTVDQFRLGIYESTLPPASKVRTRHTGLNSRTVEAAVCQAARMPGIENHFDDATLQAAHDEFKGRIGLKQLFLLCAEANGHHNRHSSEVDRDVLQAAFTNQGRTIEAAGFSTLTISNVVAATANKFIMRGWNSVDQTSMRISRIQNVRDFKTATTVSLTDNVIYEKVGASGEIKHGTLSDLTYTNKVDTYARMLAITREDIVNDDLSALTDVPMKLGAGAMKKLNDIFWTEFLGLVGASFFAAGNNNINTGVATMTEAGLDATYVIFKNQTNPDSTPLGLEPAILLVPTALEGAALRLVRSEQFVTGATTMEGSSNIWANRFQVYSSPYISNSSYTGNTSVAWWMLANPSELPVITIAALNGQVEPTVDTAEADFNTLGVQMRGYNDVGVSDTEYRGGVHADGGAS
ncbi:MAG: hypothetical protein HKN35_15765 [Woeseia sp.]|nr:hypothetical protein [Woeseia sp.]